MATDQVRKLGPYGNQSSGQPFEFKDKDFEKLKEIKIRSGNLVDAIEFDTLDDYGKPKNVKYGGTGGRENAIELYDGDVVTGISGKYKDSKISQLKIYTSSNENGYGPYGKNPLVGGQSFKSPQLNENEGVVGFCGSSDNFLSSIGLIAQKVW